MGRHQEWLPWKDALIKDFSEHLSNEMLAVALGVTTQTITIRQKKLGAYIRKSIRITDGHKSHVAARWFDASPEDIAKETGLSSSSVNNIAREIGLPSKAKLRKAAKE